MPRFSITLVFFLFSLQGCYTMVRWVTPRGDAIRFSNQEEDGDYQDALTFQKRVNKDWPEEGWKIPKSQYDLNTIADWCRTGYWEGQPRPTFCDGFWTGLAGSESGPVVFFPEDRQNPLRHVRYSDRYGIVLIRDQTL